MNSYDFRKQCYEWGIVETFDSLHEFEMKLTDQLSRTVNRDFENLSTAAVIEPASDSGPTLTEKAVKLLKEAVQDKNGSIFFLKSFRGAAIQTNGKNLMKNESPREAAEWKAALEDLLSFRLIEERGYKGETFAITREGYDYAEQI